MAYELDFATDAANISRIPRRFETFDEAWEVARIVVSLYKADKDADKVIVQFRKVE